MKLVIITPVFNRLVYLERLYHSLSKLNHDIDWVVCDDSSSEKISPYLRRLNPPKNINVHAIRNSTNQGVNKSRNNCINYALDNLSFDFLIPIDSDDYFIDDLGELKKGYHYCFPYQINGKANLNFKEPTGDYIDVLNSKIHSIDCVHVISKNLLTYDWFKIVGESKFTPEVLTFYDKEYVFRNELFASVDESLEDSLSKLLNSTYQKETRMAYSFLVKHWSITNQLKRVLDKDMLRYIFNLYSYSVVIGESIPNNKLNRLRYIKDKMIKYKNDLDNKD